MAFEIRWSALKRSNSRRGFVKMSHLIPGSKIVKIKMFEKLKPNSFLLDIVFKNSFRLRLMLFILRSATKVRTKKNKNACLAVDLTIHLFKQSTIVKAKSKGPS